MAATIAVVKMAGSVRWHFFSTWPGVHRPGPKFAYIWTGIKDDGKTNSGMAGGVT
eukprot:CAMPEP_0171634246 /NCGR_PEP_ID=MMETSP0990-20121206/25793_1 /TAXON_ID=483369 /ORGANISM="non described non described, Strain CCMP2098" /LENGTH=54 /DNA_ID=CAMNT_0012205335 /DNA_START=142 /DNA_END=306 /DNA_ORIENTATION=-